MNLFDLTGKVALVTGGGRGIGAMITRGLVEAGATVYISSRKAETGDELAAELSSLGQVVSIPANLATEAECVRLAAEIAEREPHVDVLVNNAGAAWGAPFEEFPEAGWDKVLALNLKTPFFMARAFLPLLLKRANMDDPSRIINVGSIDGMRVPPMSSFSPSLSNYSYTASKAGLHQLTRVLAKELGPRGITVNAIAPGPFPTKMMTAIFAEHGDRMAAESPLGRLGRDDDMAGAAVYLASRASAYVTAAIIPVDGGIWSTA